MGCNARIIGTDRHRGVFKQFQNYVLGNGLKRLCGAFAGCVVNYGGNNPEQTEVHRDVKEEQYGYSKTASLQTVPELLYQLEYHTVDMVLPAVRYYRGKKIENGAYAPFRKLSSMN